MNVTFPTTTYVATGAPARYCGYVVAPQRTITHWPSLLCFDAYQGYKALRDLEKQSGQLYDDRKIYEELLRLLAIDSQAERNVSDYIDSQVQLRCGFGLCLEMQMFLACFNWLGQLTLYGLRQQRLYRQDRLMYQLDDMRSTSLLLRRRLSAQEIELDEQAAIALGYLDD